MGDICLLKDSNVFRGEWRLCEVTKAMKDVRDKVRNVQVMVKPKQSGSGPYIGTKPIYLNRHVNNLIVLVPVGERDVQPQPQGDGSRRDQVVGHDEVDRI